MIKKPKIRGERLTLLRFGNGPGEDVGDGFADDDAREPTVDEVEGVKGHLEQLDQGVVPPGREHEGNEIDGGHGAGTVSDDAGDSVLVFMVGNGDDAEDDVHDDDADQDQGVEATGQGAKVDDGGELELLVVTAAQHGGIDEMALDLGKSAVGGDEVALSVIVEAGESSQMGVDAEASLPEVDEGGHQAENEQTPAGEVIVQTLEPHVGGIAAAAAAFYNVHSVQPGISIGED